MHDPANGLRRIYILGTSLNKTFTAIGLTGSWMSTHAERPSSENEVERLRVIQVDSAASFTLFSVLYCSGSLTGKQP
jgi:hypothetical protein